MLKIGDFNELKSVRETFSGVYFESESGEVFLHKKHVPEGFKIGDNLSIFVFKDSEGNLISTTEIPKTRVGEFAYLEVKDVNKFGAFLDWGVEKDIMVPFSEQKERMISGKKYFVKVYIDEETGRIAATTKINRYIEKEPKDIREGQEVELIVYKFTELGAHVIVNDRYLGMVYKDDIFINIDPGDRLKGYISKIREDNKIDISLRRKGYRKVIDLESVILEKLNENGGFLPFTDKTSAGVIEEKLEMSKNTFKKAIGGLYKQRKIQLTEEGIKLNQK